MKMLRKVTNLRIAYTDFRLKILKRRDHLTNLGVDGRMKFEWVLGNA
jgi:hypothetical protein